MVHNNGPQCADTTAVAAREGTAGQRFLIGDASLGWNPSVRSIIQHASRISNRVLLDTQRHQQTRAAKQATDTNVSNSATDLAEALEKNRETLQFNPPAERFNAICVRRLSWHRQNGHARERQLCASSSRSRITMGLNRAERCTAGWRCAARPSPPSSMMHALSSHNVTSRPSADRSLRRLSCSASPALSNVLPLVPTAIRQQRDNVAQNRDAGSHAHGACCAPRRRSKEMC
jgi:hypothetical protein